MKLWKLALLLLITLLTVPAIAAQTDKGLFTFEKTLGITGMPVIQLQMVMPGTTAETLGLEQGDLLVSFHKKDMREEYADSWFRFADHFRTQALMNNARLEIYKLQPDASYLPQEINVHIHTVHNDPVGRYFAGPSNFKYLVQEVTPGGLADQKGIKPNDFIEAVSDAYVTEMTGMAELKAKFEEIAASQDPEVVLVIKTWEQTDVGQKEGKDTRVVKANLKATP